MTPLMDSKISPYLTKLEEDERKIVQILLDLGQEVPLFSGIETSRDPLGKLKKLCQTLKVIDDFYRPLGGLKGYHETVLSLSHPSTSPAKPEYLKPEGPKLNPRDPACLKWIRAGIESLNQFAEVYPVGGAGDRLGLKDENTDEPLPQAKLLFVGKTLLEGLIRDLAGREALYTNLSGKKIHTPIVMMTSQEKNNHEHVLTILEENKWFGRDPATFFLFQQPLVPVITANGAWATKGPLELTLKPGGHGVLWKLMQDRGAFDWLKQLKKSHLIIRQINNPLAGTDMNLLALGGRGVVEGHAFGFLTCERPLEASEGMDVHLRLKKGGHLFSTITNVEYTDFVSKGIHDQPEKEGSPYSRFPSNTNILFASISALEDALKTDPLPGAIINMKNKYAYTDQKGERKEDLGGRLESTMQNIADTFLDPGPTPSRTFVLYNDRDKTISVTKKEHQPGAPLKETPPGAFLDKLKNHYALLETCGFKLPTLPPDEICHAEGPPCLFYFHPGLGPLWSVIQQKLHGGELAPFSELVLDLSEVLIRNLTLDGCLEVQSSTLEGRLVLKNVTIQNAGIDLTQENIFWKHQIVKSEEMKVILQGRSEFYAENVTFKGPFNLTVPDQTRLVAYMDKDTVRFKEEPLPPTPLWNYAFNAENELQLISLSSINSF